MLPATLQWVRSLRTATLVTPLAPPVPGRGSGLVPTYARLPRHAVDELRPIRKWTCNGQAACLQPGYTNNGSDLKSCY